MRLDANGRCKLIDALCGVSLLSEDFDVGLKPHQAENRVSTVLFQVPAMLLLHIKNTALVHQVALSHSHLLFERNGSLLELLVLLHEHCDDLTAALGCFRHVLGGLLGLSVCARHEHEKE